MVISHKDEECIPVKTGTWLIVLTLLVCGPGMLQAQGTITIDSYMDIFTADVGSSQTDSYMVYGSGFPVDSPPVNVNISGSSAFTISTSSSSGFGTSIQITEIFDGYFEAMIWVKFEPSDSGSHTAEIDHTSDAAATQSLTVDGNATTLPVNLLSFQAKREGQKVVLEWTTASEKNSSHFDVQMMTAHHNRFITIGKVISGAGTSTIPINYRFEYAFESSADKLYFRLKQVDSDQVFGYSPVVLLSLPALEKIKVRVGSNPVTLIPQLQVSAPGAGDLLVKILTINGVVVFNKSFQISDSGSTMKIDLDDLISFGKYVLFLEFSTGSDGRVQQEAISLMVN